jgi:hypothetical protein
MRYKRGKHDESVFVDLAVMVKLRDARWYQSVKAATPGGVSGKNRGNIEFGVAGSVILARLLQQICHEPP